jgi:hypothetical protein
VRLFPGNRRPRQRGPASGDRCLVVGTPPSTPSSSAATTAWTTTTDPPTGIQFALPAGSRLQKEPGTAEDGTPIEKRTYLVENEDGISVSVSIASGTTRLVQFGSIDALPAQLAAQFNKAGAKDLQILERRSVDVEGHRGLDFRISFTPLDRSRAKSIWFIRAVDDSTAVVLLQTIAFPPRGETAMEKVARSTHPRLVRGLRLP